LAGAGPLAYQGAVEPSRLVAIACASAALAACAPRDPAPGDAGASAITTSAPSAIAPADASIPDSAPPAPPADTAPPPGMALVPAGPFTMGADTGGEPDEHPAHVVDLPAFWLDLHEVTNEDWSRCVDEHACPPPDPSSAAKNGFGADTRFRGPRQPVSSVSWDDARAYCVRLGKRLPTEAEWEKAARGTDARRYPWGSDDPTPDHAVFGGGGVTRDVGTHPKGDGPYGHHDLAGNVWEWVEDIYDPYAYKREGAARGKGSSCAEAMSALDELRKSGKQGFTGSNPIPTECERVLRGGAFNYPGPGLRSSNRVHHPARYHLVMSGFRCAKDAR
jgi:formylglycine-generating enzyme required for sulfatase activity